MLQIGLYMIIALASFSTKAKAHICKEFTLRYVHVLRRPIAVLKGDTALARISVVQTAF